MTKKNILPDWYPSEIHNRQLSLNEWVDELEARSFVFKILKTQLDDIKKNCSNSFISHNFVAFLLKGDRGDRKSILNAPPISKILPNLTSDKFQYEFTHEQFGNGVLRPIMINLDYDSRELERNFKEWLDDAKKVINSRDFKGGLFRNLFESEKMSKYFKHSHHSKGFTAYTSKDTRIWYDAKVLDWIDLRLWGILMEIKYTEGFLEEAFFSRKLEGEGSLNKTTIPWAYELLNQFTQSQINAAFLSDIS